MDTELTPHRDKKETLSQNYRRLGLVSRLRGPTGGVETRVSEARTASSSAPNPTPSSSLAIKRNHTAVVSETKVERDAEGRIVRVIGGKKKRDNPLNDLLNDIEDEEEEREEMEEWDGFEDEGKTEIVRQLEEMASRPEVKRPRHVSEREAEWLGGLIEKHGDDVGAMARDMRLNPMQQTGRDIARRIRKMRGE